MSTQESIINKIVDANQGTFVIFFTYDCPYCQRALQLLQQKKVNFKGYDISKINGGMNRLLSVLNQYGDEIDFDRNHRTKPIIFIDGHFIGGYDDLISFFNKGY